LPGGIHDEKLSRRTVVLRSYQTGIDQHHPSGQRVLEGKRDQRGPMPCKYKAYLVNQRIPFKIKGKIVKGRAL